MTQQEGFVSVISSIVNAFMQFTESDIELFGFSTFDGALVHAKRVARGFCRKAGKLRDLAFQDEAEAEAVFIVTNDILSNLDDIKTRFPGEPERLVYYRMSVGYGLHTYFTAARSKQTISDWKKKGKEQRRESLLDEMRMTSDTPWMEELEAAIPEAVDREVIVRKIACQSLDQIAEATGLTRNQVKVSIRTTKKRLRRR